MVSGLLEESFSEQELDTIIFGKERMEVLLLLLLNSPTSIYCSG